MSEENHRNPFYVLTPETLSADEAVELFVQVPDFNKIYDQGHTMLNGPRGSGKSMLFRYLMPDCQMKAHQKQLKELSFFAVLVSIKNTSPNLTELRRLADKMAQIILSEHALTSYVAANLFKAVAKSLPDNCEETWAQSARGLYLDLRSSLIRAGMAIHELTSTGDDAMSAKELLSLCAELCDDSYSAISQYAKRIAFHGGELAYDGPLCDFLTFLLPMFNLLRATPFFPPAPIYLLIDDADYLTADQTRVLNSWLTTRTQDVVNIKVSTQNAYKTFVTVGGQPIRSPHDYQEINIADLYTTKQGAYKTNVHEILRKRLARSELGDDPADFFPPDVAQEKLISKIRTEIRIWWALGFGRGYRLDDDIIRYSRPTFMRRLAGTSKSSPSYSYAGIEQLIHLSSGQVRYVLHPAALMFDEQHARRGRKLPKMIDPTIQNRVLQKCAEDLMYKEFDDLKRSHDSNLLGDRFSAEGHPQRIVMLRNLVAFLGGLFRQKLLSDDAERRVFSVAISGDPDPEVEEIFDLGATYGYFHKSSIGNKEGTGRTRLYVMSRRLAPYFKLDPSSFAGYQFITNSVLQQAMQSPQRVLNAVTTKGVEEVVNPRQDALDL